MQEDNFEELVNNVTITFVTMNNRKFEEASYFFKKALPQFKLVQKQIDVVDIKGSIEQITSHKLGKINQSDVSLPFFVEESGLTIPCLGNNFPGPYIKSYLVTNRPEEIWRRCVELTKSDNPPAIATSCIYLCTSNPLVNNYEIKRDKVVGAYKFIDHVDGIITRPVNFSASNSLNSIDTFFKPNTITQPLSELDLDHHLYYSHRGKSLNQLSQMLKFLYPHIVN